MTNIILAVHLSCLSLIESGDRDNVRGSHGEVSRWQMMPRLYKGRHPGNPKEASGYVWTLWEGRVEQFIDDRHRIPTTREIALLWHCPGRLERPTKSDIDYAKRFENLVLRRPPKK